MLVADDADAFVYGEGEGGLLMLMMYARYIEEPSSLVAQARSARGPGMVRR